MKIHVSGAKLSSIVGIGEKIKRLSAENGKEYLFLNRGINSVCNIDLSEVVKTIDFNSDAMQVYPTGKGRKTLREAINQEYFGGKSSEEKISITGGGMAGLDLVFQTLDVKTIYAPVYHWGSYNHIMKIRKIRSGFYESLDELRNDPEQIKDSAVIIGDPGNPLGEKQDDTKIIETIATLNEFDIPVIFDSPYRRVFYDQSDKLYQILLEFDNTIIVESFSKSVGLSGQRIGFVHSANEQFNNELEIRLMYATNGVNAFSQILIEKLLTAEEGKKAVEDFKGTTREHIQKNIAFLKEKKLLAEDLYRGSKPVGIFAVINQSEEELLDKQIGSVSLAYFTKKDKEYASGFARICVSIPHEKFIAFIGRFD
jgi:aspartate aminotransferase